MSDLFKKLSKEKPVEVPSHIYISDLISSLHETQRLELTKKVVEKERFYWGQERRISARDLPGQIKTDIDARLEQEAKVRIELYDKVYELLEQIEKVGTDEYRKKQSS